MPASGAAAAAVLVVLLVGGNASLSSWRASDSVNAGSADTGLMRLVTDVTNTGCGAWTFTASPSSPLGPYADQPLQPGDTLTRTCHYTLDVAGDHLSGTLAVAPGTGTLPAGVSLTTTDYTLGGASQGASSPTFTSANDGQEAGMTIQLSIAPDSTPPMNTDIVLSNVQITATQTDPGA